MVKQYEIYLINLDPTVGHEIKKTRPCIVLSPDEMNEYIQTIIVAPLTTQTHKYPTRVPISLKKDGWIVLDQIRTVDRHRLIKCLGVAKKETIRKIKSTIKEMLVD